MPSLSSRIKFVISSARRERELVPIRPPSTHCRVENHESYIRVHIYEGGISREAHASTQTGIDAHSRFNMRDGSKQRFLSVYTKRVILRRTAGRRMRSA